MKTIHFKPGSPYRFNPLEYEISRAAQNAREIPNITNLLIMLSVIASNYESGGSGKGDERFWNNGMKRSANMAITLLILARVPVTIFNIRQVITHTLSEKELERFQDLWSHIMDPGVSQERRKQLETEYYDWSAGNFFLYCFDLANGRVDMSEDEKFSMQLVGNFFLREFPYLAEKTRSIFKEMLYAVCEPFNYGALRDHFTEGVSEELLPENTYQKGYRIVVDFPVKRHGLGALFANAIMKFCFQTALERRQTSQEQNAFPCFLWVDESQNLINPGYDPLFQATARESRVCTVAITQSLPALIGAMGSENPENKAKAYVANLGLKVFAANSDFTTNEFAANMIGKHLTDMASVSLNHDKQRQHSFSQRYHYQVPPEHFTSLRTGGPSNDYYVESILFKAGKRWSNGKNYLPAEFDQLI